MDAVAIIKGLEKRYASFYFHTKSHRHRPFHVLIGTVLSHRTKDVNTDKAARSLLKKYNTPEKLATASLKHIESLIKNVGLYRVKARRIKEIARIIVKNGMPNKIDGLLSLPGVGRKTANCVLVYGYAMPAIPVDTHVHRISNRIGLVRTKNPEKTEKELKRKIPRKYWIEINSLLVQHGQEICLPINPRCDACPITSYCDYYENIHNR